MKNRPAIAITMGDPAGVGPELCLRALDSEIVRETCVPIVFGDQIILQAVSQATQLPYSVPHISLSQWNAIPQVSTPLVVDTDSSCQMPISIGQTRAEYGRAACSYIEAATAAAMAKHVSAIVTNPINKESLHLANIPYPGHTEMLADLTSAPRVRMMLASDEITVSLVTIHMALREVAYSLTAADIVETIELTYNAMHRLGKEQPRIIICGFNPHAGENGLFGQEEAQIIIPAIRQAEERRLPVTGPLPPDTAFVEDRRRETDAYIVMYHDQGLIPFKMLAFDKGSNISLGLPIVRTSVDHGTAFDIAWKGRASPCSLIESIKYAVRLSL